MTELVKLTKQAGMSDRTFCEMIKLLASKRKGPVADDDLLGLYPESLAESFLNGERAAAVDCLKCGACCAYFQEIPVAVSDATPRALVWQVWDGGDRAGPKTGWLRREPCEARCVALEGDVGERVTCTIYQLRPKSCREFEPGSDRCHAVRRLYGLEPPLTEAEFERHSLLLKQRDETEISEEIDVEIYEMKLGGAKEQIPLLMELIEYNSDKLEEVIAEIERLIDLFGDSRLVTAKAKCLRDIAAVRADSVSIRQALSRLLLTDKLENLRKRELEELALKLLKTGLESQEAVDRASKRIVHLGKIAYELLEMRINQ